MPTLKENQMAYEAWLRSLKEIELSVQPNFFVPVIAINWPPPNCFKISIATVLSVCALVIVKVFSGEVMGQR